MKKSVILTDNGVGIKFNGVVEKKSIIKMVENCSTGKCDCMSEKTKNKIKQMEVKGVDGDVSLLLSGDISKEEIQEALSKSKVIN